MATSAPYAFNPAPQAGSGAYGAVPGPIAVPPSEYEQLGNLLPGLPGLTAGASGVVGSQLAGQLSPGTMNLLQDKAASGGVAGGYSGSGFQQNNALASLGLTAEGLQQQGVSNYTNFTTGLGSLQQNPNLSFEVASQNALDAAAPNPAEAAQLQLSEFEQMMAQMNNPAGGGKTLPDGVYHQLNGTGPMLPGYGPQ